MSGEAWDPGEAREFEGLREAASQTLEAIETWTSGGLAHDVALALVQNALPLLEDSSVLPRLQRRSHARVLTGLLLLLDDALAGALVTDLVEVLHDGAPRSRVLAG